MYLSTLQVPKLTAIESVDCIKTFSSLASSSRFLPVSFDTLPPASAPEWHWPLAHHRRSKLQQLVSVVQAFADMRTHTSIRKNA